MPRRNKTSHIRDEIRGIITSINAYKVTAPVDKNEGRFGGTETIGWASSRDVAERLAQGQGVMGTPGDIESCTINIVNYYDNGHEHMAILGDEIILQFEDPKEVRKRALSKLTQDEREALGIEDD